MQGALVQDTLYDHAQGLGRLALGIGSAHRLSDDLRRGQLQHCHLRGPQLGQRHGDIPICGLGIEPIVCQLGRCRIHRDLGPGAVYCLFTGTHAPAPGVGELAVGVLHHGLDHQVVKLGHGGEGVVCRFFGDLHGLSVQRDLIVVKHGLGRRVLHGYMEGVLPVGDVILRLGVGDADGKVLGALRAGGIGELSRRLRAAALADVGHAAGEYIGGRAAGRYSPGA